MSIPNHNVVERYPILLVIIELFMYVSHCITKLTFNNMHQKMNRRFLRRSTISKQKSRLFIVSPSNQSLQWTEPIYKADSMLYRQSRSGVLCELSKLNWFGIPSYLDILSNLTYIIYNIYITSCSSIEQLRSVTLEFELSKSIFLIRKCFRRQFLK